MTYRDILKTAVGMVGEEISSPDNTDYEETAPYLLATLCRECASVDRRYRMATGGGAPNIPTEASVNLNDPFPLSDALAPAAAYYLSAMLVSDENESMSDRFFSLYTDAITDLLSALPAANGKTIDKYGILI